MNSMVEWCKEERALGNGGCGACALCCKEAREEADQEVERVRKIMFETTPGQLLSLTQERDLLLEKIENANQVSSETQKSWKHRCFKIMSALGMDYGDPDWCMPDDYKKWQTRIKQLEMAIIDTRHGEHDNAYCRLCCAEAYTLDKLKHNETCVLYDKFQS